MRTTLDIADDVLFAAKEIAQREKKPWAMSSASWPGAPFRIGGWWNPPRQAARSPMYPSGWQGLVFAPCPNAAALSATS